MCRRAGDRMREVRAERRVQRPRPANDPPRCPKGWRGFLAFQDAADPVLCKALAYRIVQSMSLQWKRKRIGSEGIRSGVRVWALLKAE